MKIIHASSSNQKIPANLAVNKIGKYLYNHIDGAFKYKTSPNICDVYFLLLYQNKGEKEVNEMYIDLNITTYQNKVRVNVIEITPEERTIGYDCYSPEIICDLQSAKELVFNKVVKRISKAYSDTDFIF